MGAFETRERPDLERGKKKETWQFGQKWRPFNPTYRKTPEKGRTTSLSGDKSRQKRGRGGQHEVKLYQYSKEKKNGKLVKEKTYSISEVLLRRGTIYL